MCCQKSGLDVLGRRIRCTSQSGSAKVQSMPEKETEIMHEFCRFQYPRAQIVDMQSSGKMGVGDAPRKYVQKCVLFNYCVTRSLVN